MTAHTPDPLAVFNPTPNLFRIVTTGNKTRTIAVVRAHGSDNLSREEARAYATLLAQAPALLSALEALIGPGGTGGEAVMRAGCRPETFAAFDRARAVLAAVRGA